MDFIERIREQIGLNKADFAALIGISKQAYQSMLLATDRIRLVDLISLRKVSKLSDCELLDEIEKEVKIQKRRKAFDKQ